MPPNDTLPDATGLGGRIATLERRVQHLDRRIESGHGSPGSVDMDRGERSALVKGALPSMRWVRGRADGAGAGDPVAVLAALVAAVEAEHLPKLGSATEGALGRARALLEQWGAG